MLFFNADIRHIGLSASLWVYLVRSRDPKMRSESKLEDCVRFRPEKQIRSSEPAHQQIVESPAISCNSLRNR